MKKAVSLILTFILLYTVCPLGIPVHAQEQNDERDQILTRACIAFPEYAHKIEANTFSGSTARSSEPRELVITEMRPLSDSEFIVYTEYSDGLIVLDQGYMESETIYNSTEQSGSRTLFNITIKATCTLTEAYFKVSNLKFTIYASSYDRITSIGTPRVYNPEYTYNDCCYYDNEDCTYNLYESASEYASVCFPLQFRFAPYDESILDSYLWVEVGDNTLSVHHYEH